MNSSRITLEAMEHDYSTWGHAHSSLSVGVPFKCRKSEKNINQSNSDTSNKNFLFSRECNNISITNEKLAWIILIVMVALIYYLESWLVDRLTMEYIFQM